MSSMLRVSVECKDVHVTYVASDGSEFDHTYAYPDAATAQHYAHQFKVNFKNIDGGAFNQAAAELRAARQLNRDLIGLTDLPWVALANAPLIEEDVELGAFEDCPEAAKNVHKDTWGARLRRWLLIG